MYRRRRGISVAISEFIIVAIVAVIALAAASYLLSTALGWTQEGYTLSFSTTLDSPSDSYSTVFPEAFGVRILSDQSASGFTLVVEFTFTEAFTKVDVAVGVTASSDGSLNTSESWVSVQDGETRSISIEGLDGASYPLNVYVVVKLKP